VVYGSGLVMAVTAGSQSVSVSSGATSYVFPTAEPTGTAYTVSVQTQPTGQTCVVSAGSGASLSANVTTVSVTCTTNTFTVTASSGGNGTITPSSQSVNYNATASFTVNPATGYHVASVVGDTCTVTGSGTSYSAANIQANCAVTATFAIDTFTLTYTAGANGTISGTSPQTVSYGGNGSLVTAVPNTGYHFVQWSDGVMTAARTD
jgi:hypothetical protein